MPTTVTSSIGTTGRDYSTLQAWEDAAPANLVTSDQIWLGEAYNDSTFTAALTISGSTSDSTRYKKLTAAAGQSFVDTPSNALRYNAANGATLAFSSGYATALVMNEAHAKLSRMQVRSNGTTERTLSLGSTSPIAENCILAGNPGSSGFSGNVVQVNDTATLRNCLVEKQNTNSSGHGIYLSRATVVNCTIVNTSGTAAAKGMQIVYSGSSCVVRNNAVFGFTTAADSVGGTHQTNYTDVTSPGSGWTGGIAFTTSTFTNVTSGSWDLKLVSGSALLDVGTTDATHGTPDIFGTARPSGSAYDIGAWEYVSAGGGTTISGALGTAAASGHTGTVNASRIIAGALGTASASGLQGTVNANTTISGALGVAVASGLSGTVSNTNDTVIGGTLGIAIASGLIGAVNASTVISGNLGTAVASGLTGTVSNGTTTDLALILKILSNRQELNATTGKFTLYDDDGVTVLYESDAWEDTAGTIPYRGKALRRIDALV